MSTATKRRKTAKRKAPTKKAPEIKSQAVTKAKMGRPHKLQPDDQTLRVLRGLGRIQATVVEAAAMLEVSKPTFLDFLDRHEKAREAFEHYGKGMGLTSLRRKMWQKATEGQGSVAMMIWLSKQHLGMRETIEQQVDTTSKVEVEVTHTLVAEQTRRLATILDGIAHEKAAKPINGVIS